jgi:hypothetical protein
MRKILLLPLFCLLLAAGARAQTLSDLPRPQLWLRADQGTISSSLWTDVSGHRRHATALQGPTLSDGFNFNPALHFDGIDDIMQLPYSLEGLAELTIIAVFQSADTTERGVIGAENYYSRKVKLTTARVTGPDSVVTHYGNHGRQAVISALVQSWADAGATSEGAFLLLGSTGTGMEAKLFKGKIAEVLVYDRALNFLERQQVKTYLAIKYGISLTEGNYLSSSQAVLWEGEQNGAFSHRISGLGSDDAFGLHQKQARNAADTSSLLVLSAGPLAPSNQQNGASLRDGDFLLWGDTSAPLTLKKGEGQDSLLSILERKWLLQASGETASQISTELQLDISQLPKDSLGYWLVIDRSGMGRFTADQLEYQEADSLSPQGIAYYRNLRWDNDRSGKDQFGFARAKKLLAVASQLTDPDCDSPQGGRATLRVIGGEGPYEYSLSRAGTSYQKQWRGADSTALDTLSAGTYTLRVKDAARQQASWTFSLRLPNALLVDLGEDLELMEGEELVLDASTHIPDSIPATYLWQNNFGFKSKEASIRVKEAGIYTVSVSNAEGCVFTDQIVISGATDQRIAVFPTVLRNSKHFNVSISLPEAGPVRVQVRSINGTIVQQLQGRQQTEHHFLGSVSTPGLYLVVVETPQGTKTKRIVVY